MIAQEQLWQMLANQIRMVKPNLDGSALQPQASLTGDLGLDSLDLVRLSARLASDFPEVDLTPWLAQACRPGMDTLSSIVAHLERQLTQITPPVSHRMVGLIQREQG